ncbi:tail tape measure protein [Vibrio phage jenny 12G5]|nr:tail tape measure protein [Vibrio phage jenny 12G5]
MAQLVVEVTEKGIKKVDYDLAKLGKTGTSTEKSLDKTGKTSNNLSVSMKGLATTTAGVTAGMVAAGAAVAATTIAIAAQVVATDNLRRVSGLSIDQFEASAFAAQQYGLGVEQLGDAFKDTSERIGDFIATGGGPLQDFADVMGYTADQTLAFAREVEGLSGKDVLVRMVSELENAGASTEEMSFALEGMASDLTLLLPLLQNGGKEFDRLTQAMGAVTVPLDQEDIDTFRDLNEAVGLVTGAMGSLLNEAVLPLVQPMTELAEATAFFIASLNEGTEAQLTSELVDLTERSRELKESIEANESAWGRLTNVATFESTDNDVLIKELDEVNAKIDETRGKLTNLRFGTTDSEGSTPLELQMSPVIPSSSVSAPTTGGTEEINFLQEQADLRVEIIRQSLLTEDQLKAEQLERDIESIENSTLLEQEQADLLLGVWEEYYADKEAVAAAAADEIERQSKREAAAQEAQTRKAADAWDTMTQDLKSTLGEQNALYKASATVNATIKAYEAANSAYAALAGVPIVGPALGAAAAGVAVAAGLANVAAINSSRAQGGQVNAGDSVLVGERGAEIVTFGQGGRVTPNSQIGGANGQSQPVNVIVNNNAPNTQATATQDDEGNTYVTIEELDSLVGVALSNPNSDSYQGLSSVASLQRS